MCSPARRLSCPAAWLGAPDPRTPPSSPGSARPREPQEALGSGFHQVWIPLLDGRTPQGHGEDSSGRWASRAPQPSDSGSELTCPLCYEPQSLCPPGTTAPCSPRLPGHPAPRHFKAHLGGSQPAPAQPFLRGLQLCRGEAPRSWVLTLLGCPLGSPRASGLTPEKVPGPLHGHL